MSPKSAFIIEIDDLAAGIIVPEDHGHRFFRFVSADSAFARLDGLRFSTPRAAERAARELVAGKGAGKGERMRRVA